MNVNKAADIIYTNVILDDMIKYDFFEVCFVSISNILVRRSIAYGLEQWLMTVVPWVFSRRAAFVETRTRPKTCRFIVAKVHKDTKELQDVKSTWLYNQSLNNYFISISFTLIFSYTVLTACFDTLQQTIDCNVSAKFFLVNMY